MKKTGKQIKGKILLITNIFQDGDYCKTVEYFYSTKYFHWRVTGVLKTYWQRERSLTLLHPRTPCSLSDLTGAALSLDSKGSYMKWVTEQGALRFQKPHPAPSCEDQTPHDPVSERVLLWHFMLVLFSRVREESWENGERKRQKHNMAANNYFPLKESCSGSVQGAHRSTLSLVKGGLVMLS